MLSIFNCPDLWCNIAKFHSELHHQCTMA